MEVIRHLHNLRPRHKGCVATIGSFDGVHLGHRTVLDGIARIGREQGLPTTLVTFEPQPREFFSGADAPARLTRFREKMTALSPAPLDRVLVLRFDRALAEEAPTDFVREVLVRGLGVSHLVVGDDFRFGRGARGDVALLQALGADLGFTLSHLPTVCVDGERVSSSRVRTAIAAGELDLAARLLGRPYAMCGRVAPGRRLGRQIGFPTANVDLKRRVAPVRGVYAVRVRGLDAQPLGGMANVGTRPTVDGSHRLLEVHLFDYDGDLYGRELSVEFVAHLRGERRFPSIDALGEQLRRDADAARRLVAVPA